MTEYSIYALMHPQKLYIYYVGYTSKHIQHRLYQHMQEATKDYDLHCRARKVNKHLIEENIEPIVIILDSILTNERAYAKRLEALWIAHVRAMGHPIDNRKSYATMANGSQIS